METRDEALLEKIREAYTPPALDAARFDAALEARLTRPARRPWLLWSGLAAAAAAAAILVWSATPAPTPIAPSPQIASALPAPTASPLLAELDIEADLVVDETLEGLPDEYVELAAYLEL